MFAQAVVRSFSRSLGKEENFCLRTYRIVGMGESYVEERSERNCSPSAVSNSLLRTGWAKWICA